MKNVRITNFILAAGLFLASVTSATAHPAWGIAVDGRGQIYFSDLETIWRIDVQGKTAVWREGVRGRHTHEINLDENGNLYGADNEYEPSTERWISALWKITPDLKFSYVFAPTYEPPPAFTVWRDRAGNRYYAGQGEEPEQREFFVLERSPNGSVTRLSGSKKAAEKHRQVIPYGVSQIVLTVDGALYFRDGESIRKVSPSGEMTILAKDMIRGRFGFTIDGRGDFICADWDNRRVVRISPDGATKVLMSAEAPWSPTGVTLSGDDLYVLEAAAPPNARVRKLSPDGKITVLATVGKTVH